MKIAMFSINPIFPKMVTGGASKHLFHIARHLGSQGHEVKIFSARSGKNQAPFPWADHVLVEPVLPFNLPFPQPYAISGGDLALIVERMSAALQDADRFYMHDGEFLLPDVYENIPTTISFRDNTYPESVLGSFIGKFDRAISVSPYSAEVIKASVGRFYPELSGRLHQVNNGIDLAMYKPVTTGDFVSRLGVDKDRDFIILHPHRPEPGKGLPETIQVAHRLVHHHKMANLKVLVPEWIGSMVSQGESHFYDEMMHLMRDLGVKDNFIFIPWLSQEQMPALYSLGDVTLCLGNFVEAFGNVAYESQACGTPSVVARVGVHRTLLPDEMIAKVDPGDIHAAVDVVLQVASGGWAVRGELREYFEAHFNYQQQVQTYAELITTCEKQKPMTFTPPVQNPDQAFQLAPWCYFAGERIYHDFRQQFEDGGGVVEHLRKDPMITQKKALAAGVSAEAWHDWLERTYLVPLLKKEGKSHV